MACLIYGCYGYTGRLLVDEALRRGLRPTLAGRRREEVEAMGRSLGLPVRVAALDDTAALDAAVSGHRVVLHAAGPFIHTSPPMVQACLRAGAHYLDVTGEIAVFEAAAAQHAQASARGVTLLPGVGFDVVPSDCLAAYVAARLPGATELDLGLQPLGGVSRGTALTMIEGLDKGGASRRGGRIVPEPVARHRRQIDFGEGAQPAVSIPWGDVSTAYHSTGIGDITVYVAVPLQMRVIMRLSSYARPILGLDAVKQALRRWVRARGDGPSETRRARGQSRLYAEARKHENGVTRRAAARLVGPDGYTLTALSGIRAVERVLAGGVPTGFQTPSRALGADFVLDVPGVRRVDVSDRG